MRFTVTNLRAEVENLNESLAEKGADVRFTVGGRNGYQAVDEYPVDAEGNRIGTGVNRMVGSGTSRETYDETYQAYLHILRRLDRERIERLEEENAAVTLEQMQAASENQSILYVADGAIHKIGPFNSNDDVINAAVDAQEEGEYDIQDQHVYILNEDRLIELEESDLVRPSQE